MSATHNFNYFEKGKYIMAEVQRGDVQQLISLHTKNNEVCDSLFQVVYDKALDRKRWKNSFSVWKYNKWRCKPNPTVFLENEVAVALGFNVIVG